jgi:hypothetical protein
VVGLQLALVLGFVFRLAQGRSAADPAPARGVASVPLNPVPATRSQPQPTMTPAPRMPTPPPDPSSGIAVSINDALGRNWLFATYRGNGRDALFATLASRTEKAPPRPLLVSFPAGTVFETADHNVQMVLARPEIVLLAPGETKEFAVAAVATHLNVPVGNYVFLARPTRIDRLDPLFTYLESNPWMSVEAIQTAVLVMQENPALSAFAKFTLVSGVVAPGQKPPLIPGDGQFRVPTQDIIAALIALKEIGLPRRNLLLAGEPQLKIESMIDPLAHADAMRYYDIRPDREWGYWREELLKGDMSTRHYALYGIGRYFPDTALQMLPSWARQESLPTTMRVAAIQAMAETGRIEAISLLQQIGYELGGNTEYGQAARAAIGYLENRREQPAATKPVIEFKGS